ncbi:MAG: hypothetical protein O3B22_10125 [Proteobacteria bacterium]|nr:hypothetical protein [Pseudomonadota bacterium]MDA1071018.1 hypothetical protein [Pseudomonadota bacterium]
MPHDTNAADLVRLDLYPLDKPGDPRLEAVIAKARADIDRDQVCVLENFITEAARKAMVDEAMATLPLAHTNRSHRTCFLNQKPNPDRPADHPMNMFFDARYRMMAYDLFDPAGPLPRFYGWKPVREMIAAILGLPELHLNDDPYQPANIICYGDGDRSTWHFDRGNEFTTTLMLQEPEGGGVFEIAPEIWPDDEHDPADLRRVLLEQGGDLVRRVDRVPASLVIFRGDRSVHRVTEVKGERLRLMAVMVYEDRPGVIGRPEVNATVYGPRVAAAQAAASA